MSTREARSCPACAGTRSAARGEVAGFSMVRCENCGTLFTAELPGPASSHDYESYYHAGNLDVPEFVHGRLGELVGSFEGRRRLNRWLDVGCGAGTLMQSARHAGWDVVGTEVAGGAAEAMRAKGFEVLVGELGQLELPDAGFDVVSMVEVVEHVPDARALLMEAARHIRPGGALYVTTPHARGISGRLLGTTWSVVAPPEHLQLFSVPGLRLALEGSGLTVGTLRTHAVNPNELLRAVRSGHSPLAAGSRVDESYRLNETLSSSRSGALLKRVVNAALNATRLGDSIKLVAERQA